MGGIAIGIALSQLLVIWLARTLEGQIESQKALWSLNWEDLTDHWWPSDIYFCSFYCSSIPRYSYATVKNRVQNQTKCEESIPLFDQMTPQFCRILALVEAVVKKPKLHGNWSLSASLILISNILKCFDIFINLYYSHLIYCIYLEHSRSFIISWFTGINPIFYL